MRGIALAEAGLVPDALIRIAIRRMLAKRLREMAEPDCESERESLRDFVESLRRSPVALVPERANEQHYEVSPAFFERVLGRRLKYSCALWSEGSSDLDAAEEQMLSLTCQRAEIRDGMRVLDLGCGWGSLTLFVAERFPGCRVLAVSNSKLQREYIADRAARLGLSNVEVETADINRFEPDRRFDRVVSVEMFEHLRNVELLLARIATWLEPDGKLFVHLFCHRRYAYPYEARGEDDWMARHFFTGGMMPSDDLLLRFQHDLVLEDHWRLSGLHYHRTCEAWLGNLDHQSGAVLPVLSEVYGSDHARLWYRRWRLFFLACSELFAYRGGAEWWVSHYRLAHRSDPDR